MLLPLEAPPLPLPRTALVVVGCSSGRDTGGVALLGAIVGVNLGRPDMQWCLTLANYEEGRVSFTGGFETGW